MAQRYKIFGERNSGTNLIRSLVNEHIGLIADDVYTPGTGPFSRAGFAIARRVPQALFGRFPRILESVLDRFTTSRQAAIFGWKHSVPDIALLRQNNILPIIVTKHPTYWSRSFHNKPFHSYNSRKHDPRSHDYIPRRIENMDRRPIKREDLIILKFRAYQATLMQCGGIHVQYESLIHFFDECQKSLRSIAGGCSALPREEARPFITTSPVAYRDRYPLDIDPSLECYFSKSKLDAHAELLAFFGYSPSTCRKSLPALWQAEPGHLRCTEGGPIGSTGKTSHGGRV